MKRQTRRASVTGKLLWRSEMHPPNVVADEMLDAHDHLETLCNDLETLADELHNLSQYIDGIVTVVKEQMEISQGFWSTVLAFVLAIYVPVSFASSIFGMNILDKDQGHWTNTTQYADPVAAVPSAESRKYEYVRTSAAGTRARPISTFIATALSLALGGVVLPLIAGHIFRAILLFAYRNRIWGRVLIALLPLGVLMVLDYFSPYAELAILETIAFYNILGHLLRRNIWMMLPWVGMAAVLFGEWYYGAWYLPQSFVTPPFAVFTLLCLWIFSPHDPAAYVRYADILESWRGRRSSSITPESQHGGST